MRLSGTGRIVKCSGAVRGNLGFSVWVVAAGLIVLNPRMAHGGEPATQNQLLTVLKATQKNGAAWLRHGSVWVLEREATQMLASVVHGRLGRPGSGPSWYRPSQSRYTWAWLAERMDSDGDDAISNDEFRGRSEWFEVLDRDRDGKITARDLDWSDNSRMGKANSQAKALFYEIDSDRDGQVTTDEWLAYMKKLGRGKDRLAMDDLLPLVLTESKPQPKSSKGTDGMLLKAIIDGDIGSWFEGPDLGSRAKDFTLRSLDGASVTLSDSFSTRPTVLIFGSFT